jgi:cobaltochelatase CobN
LQETAIPAGMHILGALPEEQVQREALLQYLKFGFEDKDLPLVRNEVEAWAKAIFEDRQPEMSGTYAPKLRDRIQTQWADSKTWIENLRKSPQTEVDALVTVLSGHYLPAAPVGDPLKNPAGLPTGTKQYGFDPALIPTKAAWGVGHRMAEETLAKYKEQHGKYPEKISIVLWYGETIGHHGVMESMALDLMGVRVGWNARNQPDSLTLVPESEMTHPRVDVVFSISGMYRDGFGEKINFLSRAIRMVAEAGDNAISRHDRENAAALMQAGTNAVEAEKIARARFFGPKPGTHDNGVDHFVEQSKNAEDTDGIAKLELARMAYAYSPDVWGKTAPQALETQLKGNEVVLFSRSSSLIGAVDNDDVYGFVGALSNASKYVNGGQAPDFYLNNLRKSGSERPVDLKTWLATELNQRNWNPKWLEHMKKSGYAGARQMADEMEFLYGFQATTADSMDGTFWQNSYDVYVADKYGMELDKFFEKENPHAKQAILARMLQVDREGSYRFSEADRNKLLAEYVRSVVKNGVACSANICGNEKLQQFVASAAATVPGLGQMELQQFGKTLAKATHWNVSEFRNAPAAVRAGMIAASQQPRPRAAAPSKPSGPPHVEGFAMQEKIINLAKEASSPVLPFAWAWVVAILLIIAAGSAWEASRSSRTV